MVKVNTLVGSILIALLGASNCLTNGKDEQPEIPPSSYHRYYLANVELLVDKLNKADTGQVDCS